MHGLLKQKGKQYSGAYTGYFWVSHSPSRVDIALKVAKAKVIDGEWRATKLEGTIDSSETPQFGCSSAEASQTVKALLRESG